MKFPSFPSFPPPQALLGWPPNRAFYHLFLKDFPLLPFATLKRYQRKWHKVSHKWVVFYHFVSFYQRLRVRFALSPIPSIKVYKKVEFDFP